MIIGKSTMVKETVGIDGESLLGAHNILLAQKKIALPRVPNSNPAKIVYQFKERANSRKCRHLF